jgi:glycogen debranching enzyme
LNQKQTDLGIPGFTEISTRSNERVQNTFDQSVHDIGALRCDVLKGSEFPPIPAAGVPWFMTVFGRDSLIVALQSMLVHPRLADGTLAYLSKRQARKRDDWRDAQPGKILHEMRFGELAHFNETPHGPYYGTADATILFLIVFVRSLSLDRKPEPSHTA